METETYHPPRGTDIPNHPDLPLILVRQARPRRSIDVASWFQQTFRRHGWGGNWRGSVFDYHHFHPDAFEVLGVGRGQATLQLGGPQGRAFQVEAGDLLILPPGTGHGLVESSTGFQVIGAYPPGQHPFSTFTGLPDPPDPAIDTIRAVPLPERHPLHGGAMEEWGS